MKKSNLVFSLSLLMLAMFSACSTPKVKDEVPASGVVSTIITLPSDLKTGDSMVLSISVDNNTKSDYKFLKWNSPYEQSFLGDYLKIMDDKGERTAYHGAMAKRMMPPPAESYITVPAGQSEKSSIDITKAYTLEKAGKYTIQFEGMNGTDSIPASNVLEFEVK